MLKQKLTKILSEFQIKRPNLSAIKISALKVWNIQIDMTENEITKYQIRNLRRNDLPLLREFRDQLSQYSRDMFCPYPWNNEKNIDQSLTEAVQKSLNKIDASFFLLREKKPIGHFFLWKAKGNPYSQKYGLEIPELGIAVADAYQRQGFGQMQINILLAIAKHLNKDAIELTTSLSNNSGWQTYLKTGFTYMGIIKNPLEIDVTEAANDRRLKIKWRKERQMVFIINQEKKSAIIKYLTTKRDEFEKLSRQ